MISSDRRCSMCPKCPGARADLLTETTEQALRVFDYRCPACGYGCWIIRSRSLEESVATTSGTTVIGQ